MPFQKGDSLPFFYCFWSSIFNRGCFFFFWKMCVVEVVRWFFCEWNDLLKGRESKTENFFSSTSVTFTLLLLLMASAVGMGDEAFEMWKKAFIKCRKFPFAKFCNFLCTANDRENLLEGTEVERKARWPHIHIIFGDFDGGWGRKKNGTEGEVGLFHCPTSESDTRG